MSTRTTSTTALTAIIELRALMAAEVYVGGRVRTLVDRAVAALPKDTDREETADILRAYLSVAELERTKGVGPFSLLVAEQYLDEIEVMVRRNR